ncbi:esterase/lipase family protein [Niveibacterium umoris]|uniref:Triacylglycerol lipase n=1 Tax=Niveibacterium umoris TaxID=1193620 RepID=A0A840BFH4_9RHOO|nr:triacylglycerol lipase [Niveibacterium umoris]MBB4011423.1 triacylglycerol lipase [Niveibacterium umoris]
MIRKCLLVLLCFIAVLQSSLARADTYTQTRYPIVLVHGMLGFDSIGAINYWYGIPEALRAGGATVFVASVSALNSNEARGEQVLKYLQVLQAKYGYQKFNLIGHSHGGATSRYVAAVAPGLVASVTTVGAPHDGSKVADAIKAGAGATGTTDLVTALVNGLGQLIGLLSGNGSPQDALGTLASLNTAGARDFNRRFPAGAPTQSCGQGPELAANGVRYYSAGGTSVATNVLDVLDPMLIASSLVFGFEANDGLVSRCSSHWGKVLRDDYGWNHIDEINHLFGLRGLFSSDPTAFYRSQANRLRNLGL